MEKIYQIEGMHCSSCIAKITTALNGMAEEIHVTLNPPQAVLKGNVIADIEELNKAVALAGNYMFKPSDSRFVSEDEEQQKSWFRTYYPLFLIVSMIALVSLRGENTHDWMLNFMAGFFLVFGTFKLLDICGFRDAYATYDLLAKRWHAYGLLYPFLELALGFAFLFRFELKATLWASILLMGFSSLGVIQALTEKRKIRCACLGTSLNLPMSTITLVEDLGMVAMSVWMLFYT